MIESSNIIQNYPRNFIVALEKQKPESVRIQALLLGKLVFRRGRGIRTPGTRKGSPVFKTGAINRSTIPLCAVFLNSGMQN